MHSPDEILTADGKTGAAVSIGGEREASVGCIACGSLNTEFARDDLEDFEYGVVPRTPLASRGCRDCGTEFLFPRPSAADLIDFYPSDYHAYNEDHGRLARLLVRIRAAGRVRSYVRLLGGRSGSLFDVGAGDCRHFDELRKKIDLRCAGVELNPEVAAAGRARGYDVVDGTLEELDIGPIEGTFDLVSMNHVLEHVIEPRVVIERAFRLLRPGGHIVGQLPCITSWEATLFGRYWGGYHFPRHLQMFSKAGLSELLRHAGFESVRVRTAPHVLTALSLQNTLIGRTRWHPTLRYGKSSAYSACIVLSLPFEGLVFVLDKGGIVNFVARRPITA